MTGQPDSTGQAAQPADQDISQNFTELRSTIVAVNQLGDNVREGKVTLDPAVGASLLAALREHADDVTEWQQRVGDLAQPLPMGNNPVGAAMGGKFAGRATGQDMALASVLATYHEAVLDATNAIDEAMRRYADTEDGISQAFNRMTAN